jgi:flagellar basal-body rod protein FlgB
MPDSLFSDDAFRSAKIALDGLNLRQQIIGRNISNVDTPGYRSQTVRFEDALKSAMKTDQHIGMESTNTGHLAAPRATAGYISTPRPGGSVRADGNNVDIDVEMIQMSEDAIRYQTMSQLVSKKLLLLKTISIAR